MVSNETVSSRHIMYVYALGIIWNYVLALVVQTTALNSMHILPQFPFSTSFANVYFQVFLPSVLPAMPCICPYIHVHVYFKNANTL